MPANPTQLPNASYWYHQPLSYIHLTRSLLQEVLASMKLQIKVPQVYQRREATLSLAENDASVPNATICRLASIYDERHT